jgi:hypothetical protein
MEEDRVGGQDTGLWRQERKADPNAVENRVFHIVTCLSDSGRGCELDIGFIDYLQVVIKK